MSLKTFFQPWLIPPNPALSWLSGQVMEYDPLQDADDLTEEAASWVVDAVDQLAYARDLYTEVAENALAEIARQRKRRVSALKAVSDNDAVIDAMRAALPPCPEEPVVTEVPVHEDTLKYVDDTPWFVPTIELPEPVTPKRRRARKTVQSEVKEEQL